MVISFIFFALCQLQISDTQFNLYQTDQTSLMGTFGHDCLYIGPPTLFSFTDTLGSFCIRVDQFNDAQKSCYGTTIIFKQLKTNNVSISDLFYWNAVIEIIDLYEKYLRFPTLVDDNEVYCNCSNLVRFGKFCQYQINTEDNQRHFGELLFDTRLIFAGTKEENSYLTCYVGFRCQTNLFCLDWRQVCNGIVDCDHGEDEPADLCLQMETNQCHPDKEFRCSNGLCIPMSIVYNDKAYCPDLSDLRYGMAINHLDATPNSCWTYNDLKCDEINRNWKQFSCNNHQSILYSELTSLIACRNNYHLIYLRKLFSTNDENQCWKSMICLTGFDYLYSHINCSNPINIQQSCPTEFYFPSNSIVYSFVYFLYDQNNRIDWMKYSSPNSICYQKQFCSNHTFDLSTFAKNDLTCFSIDQRSFSWKNFYEYIVHLFGPCFSSPIPVNHPILYQCNRSLSLISIYRLKDKKKDCFHSDDEDENIDICSLNTNDLWKCFTNQNQCIRESLLADNEDDCADGSDEYLRYYGASCQYISCGYRSLAKRTASEMYRFDTLCDHVVDRRLFPVESNETDETDCEYWPFKSCNPIYARCNGIWNCPNGRDELGCGVFGYEYHIRRALQCKIDEHYCVQLINRVDVNATCIHMNRAGDGVIDCIGGTDERFTSICNEKYPTEFKRRFHCMNSSVCVRPDQVCDRIVDCPFHDDELVCPWLLQDNSSAFYCRNYRVNPIVRCEESGQDVEYCRMKESYWFCDLEHQVERSTITYRDVFEYYPPVQQNIEPILFRSSYSNQLMITEKQTSPLMDMNGNLFVCRFGYPIKSSIFNNKTYCLCPPAYYGDYCQYQSERVTISLGIQHRYSMNPSTVFRLMIYLFNENQSVLSYDQLVFNQENFPVHPVLPIYLMSSRMTNLSLHEQSNSKFVRIDSYIIRKTNVEYISSWFFRVFFPFLPVNRLTADLRLVNESFKVIYCKKRCGLHGKCLHYINAKEKEYCWCDQGWFGESCQLKSSSCHSTSCSPHSHCISLNEEKKQTQCICPLGKSGDQCYITHNACSSNPCNDDDICLPLDQRLSGYSCICDEIYNERDCDDRDLQLHVSIDSNIIELSTIPAIITILAGVQRNAFFQHRFLNKDIKLPAILKLRKPAPNDFGFVQMFHNFSISFYYMIFIRRVGGGSINTSVVSENLCRNINELFNETILNEYSYLKRLKLYHLPCNHDHNLRCFFDQHRMCMCTRIHNAECFFFSHKLSHCDYCENGGLCVVQDLYSNPWNFVCLCPKCTYGSLCQFAPKNYFISFDMLVGIDMNTEETSLTQQPTIIHLTLTFLLLILIISLIFNTISIIIFSKKKLRQVGCDLYLLHLTIISQIGLILLFLRFLYMIIIQMYIIENLVFVQISCIVLEYSIRLIPSLFDWLTVCISFERAYTLIKDVQFTKFVALKTLKLSRWIILIVFVLNILTTFHRPFYLRLSDEVTMNDEPRGHPWCVLDFGSTSWDIYEKCITISHLILPFVFNLLSMIGFIFYKIKFELISMAKGNKDNKYAVTKKQLLKYKPLIISPTAILLLEFPRFVLTFTLACFNHAWKRYVYLIGYLISFIPLTGVLFIYVLPSPKYREQLQIIFQKIFRLSLFK